MLHEYNVTVKNIVKETDTSVSVVFDVPENAREAFQYKQGQNITLIKAFDGKEERRSYSICNSVKDNAIRVGIKKIEGGLFSSWANDELKVGDTLQALPPSGHFYTELSEINEKHYLGVAAGSGITPILSILKTTLETEPKSTVTLLYGNQSTDTVMFLEEIENLKNIHMGRLDVFHILSRESQQAELLSGRIDSQKISLLLDSILPPNKIDEVFLCGPYEMVVNSKDVLMAAGVNSASIHTELFGAPEDLQQVNGSEKPELSEEERKSISQLDVIIDAKTTQIELNRGGETILDAALKVRKDLPFACKGGVCATCKAKVVSGEVEMDINYSLSDEEVEAGFILTCQSHPVSEQVVVSFDEK